VSVKLPWHDDVESHAIFIVAPRGSTHDFFFLASLLACRFACLAAAFSRRLVSRSILEIIGLCGLYITIPCGLFDGRFADHLTGAE
jgi:hypothetical protein